MDSLQAKPPARPQSQGQAGGEPVLWWSVSSQVLVGAGYAVGWNEKLTGAGWPAVTVTLWVWAPNFSCQASIS